ncbi:MAG TPA: NADH:ubiquinone oxidoreductase subunit NDUFA12 [Aestuariivirga sp.]|jgi:NADH:ubiquinone oxidoreductase subunit|nr:NADH:ubiquinone oxidoreductase subunit NDUFA12 [Aestuariivirga sp.]
MLFIKQFLTWWNGQTLATRFFTWRRGEFVGQDEFGNKYYRTKSAIPDSIPEHRWVIYNGYSDGSRVPPGWHGWIHHRVDTPPKDGDYRARPWEKPHLPNLSGTAEAYRPPGSIAQGGKPAEPAADYQAWRP